MNADIVIDYEKLTEDKVISIKIVNVKTSKFQIQLVDFLLMLVNTVSPVRFEVKLEV